MDWQEEKIIAGILSRKITGTATPEEEASLAEWVSASKENKTVYENLVSGATVAKRQRLEGELDIREELREVKQRARRMIRRRRMRRGVSMGAAAAALLIGVIFISEPDTQGGELALTAPGISQAILTVGNTPPVQLKAADGDEGEWSRYVPEETEAAATAMIRVEVPNGGEYKLRLEDGTVVWLNSETSIEYPAKFRDGERRVNLSGEAYFEVRHDGERPFVVTTGQASVTVLGTSFNVSAYAADKSTTTTLLSGKVEVCNDDRCVELSPGKQALVSEGVSAIPVEDVDAKLYMAWTTGMFEFENMRLEDICTRLSRWYGVSFRFDGDTADERFTGAIWKYKPLGELLEGIELVTDVSFSYNGDKVIASYTK